MSDVLDLFGDVPGGGVSDVHQVVQIPFGDGRHIDAVVLDGKPCAIFHRLCESIGVGTQAQKIKLRSKPWAWVREILVQLPGDSQRRRVDVIDRRTLTSWTASISIGKVKSELRPMLTALQVEAADALDAYFNEGQAVNPRPLGDPLAELERESELRNRLLAGWKEERRQRLVAEARADKADERVEAITGGTGYTPSDWREMFLLTPEREFFEHLYRHGYLIDQRGTRSYWKDGQKVYRSGPDHGKPRAPLGDLYFKLEPKGAFGDKDRVQTVVRPTMHEALRDRLVAEGLVAIPPNHKQIGA